MVKGCVSPPSPRPPTPTAGFDYKGEPTPFDWPSINSHFGAIDIAGLPKDNFYYYQSVWRPDLPVFRLVPHHWDW